MYVCKERVNNKANEANSETMMNLGKEHTWKFCFVLFFATEIFLFDTMCKKIKNIFKKSCRKFSVSLKYNQSKKNFFKPRKFETLHYVLNK